MTTIDLAIGRSSASHQNGGSCSKRFIRAALERAAVEAGRRDQSLHIGQRQGARYHAERNHPSGRNLGPAGAVGRGWRTCSWVVIDVALRAGALYNGRALVAPARLSSFPVSARLNSNGAAKKAPQRLRGRYPSAYIVHVRYSAELGNAWPASWDGAPVFAGEPGAAA